MKVRKLQGQGQVFFCPGCEHTHAVSSRPNEPRWEFNEDYEKPTFSPSILVSTIWSQREESMKDDICHSFVRDGRIEFLSDCTHKLAGQTVEIPDWPYASGSYGGVED